MSPADEEKWITVAGPGPKDVAEAQFSDWKREQPESARRLKPSDIRIDVMRAVGGRTLYRYCVRNPRKG
jgi:hypothetical protein